MVSSCQKIACLSLVIMVRLYVKYVYFSALSWFMDFSSHEYQMICVLRLSRRNPWLYWTEQSSPPINVYVDADHTRCSPVHGGRLISHAWLWAHGPLFAAERRCLVEVLMWLFEASVSVLGSGDGEGGVGGVWGYLMAFDVCLWDSTKLDGMCGIDSFEMPLLVSGCSRPFSPGGKAWICSCTQTYVPNCKICFLLLLLKTSFGKHRSSTIWCSALRLNVIVFALERRVH